MREMSDLVESDHTTCRGSEFRKFFETPAQERELPKIQENPLPRLAYTTSWVRDTSFEVFPTNDVTEHTKFETSDLPSTVGSVKEFSKKKEKSDEPPEKRKKIVNPAGPTTPTTVPRLATINFFESVARANREIKSAREAATVTPTRWRVQKGIYVEETNESNTAYDELMGLFGKNTQIYSTISFEHTYSFDWDHYSKGKMQYVVFTKVCQDHGPEMFVEMTKEDTKCRECSGSNLNIAVRLTIPLNLNEISLSINENLGIHVAFLPEKFPNFDKNSHDFTPKINRKMLNLYRNVLRGRTCREYEDWLTRVKDFVKSSLTSKSLRLHHGRVVRRKLEEIGNLKKRRCFIFADVFDFESAP